MENEIPQAQLDKVKPLVASIKNAPAATAANAAAVAEGPPPTLPIEPVPAPAQPTASAPAAEPAATPVPAAEAKAAPPNPALPPWKDGKYEGWGSCRHGDIQAAVTIEGGRIMSATIAQCLTRYSCDIIDILPPQVAKKQSPNVDSVGGATQSADAFYYAVYDALAKAK